MKVVGALQSKAAEPEPATTSRLFAIRWKQAAVDKPRGELSVQMKAVTHRVNSLKERWEKLNALLSQRKARLEEAMQSQQVCAVHPTPYSHITVNQWHRCSHTFPLTQYSIMLMPMRVSHGSRSVSLWSPAMTLEMEKPLLRYDKDTMCR